MTPGYAKIVKCPFCGKKKKLMTLNSGNSIGSQYWSDTKIISPMMPTISPVQKCPKCGKYYLEYKQEAIKTNEYSNEDGKLSYWEWKEAYTQFCTIENNNANNGWRTLFRRKKHALPLDKKDWMNIRGWFVQSYNDCFYRCPVEKEPTKEDYNLIIGVINNLVETIDWGDNNVPLFPSGVRFGSPEEEEVWTSLKNPLWKAELYREASEFKKCAETLQSIDYNDLDGFQKTLYDTIMEMMTKRDVGAFMLFDENKEGYDKSNRNVKLKKCPNGRCYNCGVPYPCFHSNETSSNDKRGYLNCSKTNTTIITKVCPQGHSYDEKEPNCPFCGDKEVVSTIKVKMPHSFSVRDFFYEREGAPVRNLKVSVDGASVRGEVYLEVYTRAFYNKYKYCVADKLGNTLTVFPNSIVILSGEGFSDTFSGREFYKMCDSLSGYLQNVCPHGHGYRVFEPCCPFCGEREVASINVDYQGHTIWYSDFYYEKEGICLHDLKAFVDGAIISGEIVLRVYHVGGSNIKYKYCIVNSLGLELTVFPKSNVIISGESFSDTFSGCEFYRICDAMFEKNNKTKK